MICALTHVSCTAFQLTSLKWTKIGKKRPEMAHTYSKNKRPVKGPNDDWQLCNIHFAVKTLQSCVPFWRPKVSKFESTKSNEGSRATAQAFFATFYPTLIWKDIPPSPFQLCNWELSNQWMRNYPSESNKEVKQTFIQLARHQPEFCDRTLSVLSVQLHPSIN